MCLAVPGRIESIEGEQPFQRTAQVSFGGVKRRVSLAYVPEAQIGDYVLVHVGFAISVVDEAEARRTLDYLRELDQLGAEDGEPG